MFQVYILYLCMEVPVHPDEYFGLDMDIVGMEKLMPNQLTFFTITHCISYLYNTTLITTPIFSILGLTLLLFFLQQLLQIWRILVSYGSENSIWNLLELSRYEGSDGCFGELKLGILGKLLFVYFLWASIALMVLCDSVMPRYFLLFLCDHVICWLKKYLEYMVLKIRCPCYWLFLVLQLILCETTVLLCIFHPGYSEY